MLNAIGACTHIATHSSTEIVCPVRYEAAGRQRKQTPRATSSASPTRPNGVRFSTASLNASFLRTCSDHYPSWLKLQCGAWGWGS